MTIFVFMFMSLYYFGTDYKYVLLHGSVSFPCVRFDTLSGSENTRNSRIHVSITLHVDEAF